MTRVPTKHTAGLTFTLSARTSAYPAPAWSLKLQLRGPSVIDLSSSPDDMGVHVITAAAADTEAWKPGQYVYSLRATDGTQVFELEAGTLYVAPSFANLAEGADVRHVYEITLDNINAVLEKRATMDQAKYRINERELQRTPLPELLQLQTHYRALVAQLRAKQRGRSVLGQVIRPLL